MPVDLSGYRVVVTGGSRGLGAEIAIAFARVGCNVVVNYVNSHDAAQNLCKVVQEKYHVEAYALQGDVSTEQGCVDLVRESSKLLGGLDIVISHIGWTKIADWTDLGSMSVDEWDMCWKANVQAHWLLMREAKPHFEENTRGGSFIMTGSNAFDSLDASSMPYTVTKAAQNTLMRSLAKKQGPKIRVNSVKPGLILTDWGRQFPQEELEKVAQSNPLQSLASLEVGTAGFL